MEPPAAVAEFRERQGRRSGRRRRIRRRCRKPWPRRSGIDKKDVICHVTLLGGGFGRKSKPDYAAEAAVLSKQLGKPVKVIWTREDDIRFDYYHTTAAVYHKAAVDGRGKPTAWLHRSAFPPIASTFAPGAREPLSFELDLGLDRSAVRRRRTSAPRTARPTRTCASAGSAPSATTSTRSPRTASPTRWRTPRAATRSSSCSTCSGPGKVLDLKAQGVDYSNYGAPYRQVPDRHAAAAPRAGDRRREGRAGASASRAAAGAWASPRTAASTPTSPRSSRSRWTAAAPFSVPRIEQVVDAGVIVNPDRVRVADGRRGGDGASAWRGPARSPRRTAGSSRATSTTSRSRA